MRGSTKYERRSTNWARVVPAVRLRPGSYFVLRRSYFDGVAMLIGVLALQGAFIEHQQMLARLGVESREVRQRKHLDGIDGLIIPGGESTTIGKLLDVLGMTDTVRTLGRDGLPIWGTCAGMILLAQDVGRPQTVLGLLDIVV